MDFAPSFFHSFLFLFPLGGEGSSKTGIEKMMESMESGDAGGLPMVRPGDASKYYFYLLLMVCLLLCGKHVCVVSVD